MVEVDWALLQALVSPLSLTPHPWSEVRKPESKIKFQHWVSVWGGGEGGGRPATHRKRKFEILEWIRVVNLFLTTPQGSSRAWV